MLNFKIRNAEVSDLDSIMRIEEDSFIPEIQEEKELFKTRILNCNDNFLIFEDDNKKSFGYICGEFLEKLPESQQDLRIGHNPVKQNPDFPYFYISSFAILKEYRGQGMGSRLWKESLDFISKQFKGNKTLLLVVNQRWEGPHHIYNKYGFKDISIYKDFFPDGDGIFCVKD